MYVGVKYMSTASQKMQEGKRIIVCRSPTQVHVKVQSMRCAEWRLKWEMLHCHFQADHGILTMGIVIPRTTAGFLWTLLRHLLTQLDLPLCV